MKSEFSVQNNVVNVCCSYPRAIMEQRVACVAGAKKGGRWGGRKQERGKGKGASPLSPTPLLSPYPLPLSTSATQARQRGNLRALAGICEVH